MRVAVFAAHPDDEALGVGGTILRHRAEGDTVEVWVAFSCRQEPPPEVKWWNLGDDPKPHVEAAVRDFDPEVVYTHHAGDLNAQHRELSEAVAVACRPYSSNVSSLRTFYTPSSSEWGAGFHPNLYVDITDHAEAKLLYLSKNYGSEVRDRPHPRSLDAISAMGEFWGSHVGFSSAEAFVVERERW